MDAPINTMEELLGDERFLAWYFKTDPDAVAAWNERIANDPQLKLLVEEAVQLLQTITIQEQPVTAQRLQAAEERLFNSISHTTTTTTTTVSAPVVPMKGRGKKWLVAASLTALAALGLWQYFNATPQLTLQTAFGETRQEVLPDGSKVMLNAHTTLNYKNRNAGADREVWVDGEAYFEVNKTAQKDRFIVHTGHFDVVVTGTSFNVLNRENRNNVLLKEGRVLIQGEGNNVYMNPGEYVEYNEAGIQKKAVDDAPVLAWTEHRFIFDNTPLTTVASEITALYGVTVRLVDEAVATSAISGIMPNDNLDVLLQALGALTEYDIVRTTNEVLIKKK